MTPEQKDAIEEFVGTWSDDLLHFHIGELLTCREADALAGALAALGAPEAAASLIEAHAEGDDEGDSHYKGGESQ